MTSEKPKYLFLDALNTGAAQRIANEKAAEGYFLINSFRVGDYSIVLVMEKNPEEWSENRR